MDVSSVDLNLLRVFDAIIRHGTLTAAGESVGLTQPGVSNALTRLRTLFDDNLFVRTPSGMQPTDFARAIAVPIRDALELLNGSLRLQRKFDPTQAIRTFHVCTSDIGSLTFLPGLLAHVRALSPGIKLKVGQYTLREAREMLTSGELDLAIGHLPDLTVGIYQRVLFDDHYVCIVSAKHPRVQASLSLTAFIAEYHALASSPGTGHALLVKHLSNTISGLHIGLEMRDFAALPAIVAKTDLIATVPSRLAGHFQEIFKLQVFPVPVILPRFSIAQLWHERSHRDPCSIWLRGVFVDLFGSPSGTAYTPPLLLGFPEGSRVPGTASDLTTSAAGHNASIVGPLV